jgi:hypothetical protein
MPASASERGLFSWVEDFSYPSRVSLIAESICSGFDHWFSAFCEVGVGVVLASEAPVWTAAFFPRTGPCYSVQEGTCEPLTLIIIAEVRADSY